MPKHSRGTLDEALKQKIRRLHKGGVSPEALQERFGIPASTIFWVIKTGEKEHESVDRQ